MAQGSEASKVMLVTRAVTHLAPESRIGGWRDHPGAGDGGLRFSVFSCFKS
jgi:hypothetical protein